MRARPEVLLLDFQHWLGLSRLPFTLHRAGCRLTVFGSPGGHLIRSRQVDEFVWAPADLNQALDQLKLHLEARPGFYQWVIFGDEAGLIAAAARRDEAWLRPLFPVSPDSGRLDVILSKTPFAAACAQHGIPCPRTIVCNSYAEIEAAAREIGYPCIVKNPLGQAGTGVRRVNSAEGLLPAFEPWAAVRPLLVQQFMTGRVGACEVLYDHGQLQCWFSSYLEGCWPPPYGASSIREVMTHPRLEDLLRRLGTMLDYHGFCGIDWFHNAADDSLVVLELNPRPTTCYHLGRFAGVDFARSVRGMFDGHADIQRPNGLGAKPPRVYMFPQHVQRCLRTGELADLRHWLPFMAAHDIPWDEPKMLLRHILRIGKLSLLYPWERLRGLASTSR